MRFCHSSHQGVELISPTPEFRLTLSLTWGFPGGTVVKNLPANARDTGSIPGPGRSPGGGNGNPLQDSSLEQSHEQEEPGRLLSMVLRRVRHDWVTEHACPLHGPTHCSRRECWSLVRLDFKRSCSFHVQTLGMLPLRMLPWDHHVLRKPKWGMWRRNKALRGKTLLPPVHQLNAVT